MSSLSASTYLRSITGIYDGIIYENRGPVCQGNAHLIPRIYSNTFIHVHAYSPTKGRASHGYKILKSKKNTSLIITSFKRMERMAIENIL